MKRLRIVSILVLATMLLSLGAAQSEEVEAEEELYISNTFEIERGQASFLVEDGELHINATVEAYPKSNLYLNSSAMPEGDVFEERKENYSLKAYKLELEETDAPESLYKENKTAYDVIDIEKGVQVVLTYSMDQVRTGYTPNSRMRITASPEGIEDAKFTKLRVSSVDKPENREQKAPPVSQDYVKRLENMSREELKNEALRLKSETISLKKALLDARYAINNVKHLLDRESLDETPELGSDLTNSSSQTPRQDERNRGFVSGILDTFF